MEHRHWWMWMYDLYDDPERKTMEVYACVLPGCSVRKGVPQ